MRLIKIFVDTDVWWHWFSLKSNREIKNSILKQQAKDFDSIYSLIASKPKNFLFLYNSLIKEQIKDKEAFESLTSSGIRFVHVPVPLSRADGTHKADGSLLAGGSSGIRFVHVPVPLSRFDGTYKFDGSLLYGGNCGGKLRELLNLDGKNHEERILKAQPSKKKKNLAHTKPRSAEFDIELLEAALEAEADLFITSDQKTILNSLVKAIKVYPDNSKLLRAYEICKNPSEALKIIQKQFL